MNIFGQPPGRADLSGRRRKTGDASEPEMTGDRVLNRHVFLFAAGVWIAELVQWFLRSLSNDSLGGPGEIIEKLTYNLLAFALTSAIWLVLRPRAPFTGWGFIRAAAPFIVIASALNTILSWAIFYAFMPDREPFSLSALDWIRAAPQPLSYLWVFFTWACFVATLVGAAEVRARERALAESARDVQEARLRALRYQVHPHLMFNSLNAIQALIESGETRNAQQMVDLLSRFLRTTLAVSSKSLVTLARELETQLLYLDIEAVRFADRLRVSVMVEPEAQAAMVPTLILQPLVENAVKHGLSRSLDGAEIEIGARREDNRLHVWIQDDAVVTASDRPSGMGIGLSNVRSRLHTQYGDDVQLISQATRQGWRSEIIMPFEVEVTRS